MRYISAFIDSADDDVVKLIGMTYPGDVAVAGGLVVTTAFAGGSPIVDVGFLKDNQNGTVDPNALGSALVATGVGQIVLDELAASTNKRCTVADQINATLSSGSPITAGAGYVWVALMNFNTLNDNPA